MNSWVHIEGVAYWVVFVAAFLGLAVWESHRPERRLSTSEGRRWSRHALVMASAYAMLILVCRTTPVLMAASVAGRKDALLNNPALPFAVRAIAAFLLLDFVRFAVHWAHHAFPILWRVHFVHHSDPDYDVSTSARFHPIEIVLTQGIYLGSIALLAPPLAAVLLAELATCFQSFFVHANASLPQWLERPLRVFWMTPDLHRIHHSEDIREQSSNFGEIFPWWDRIFRTYCAEPAAGRDGWAPGLAGFQNERSMSLWFMLAHPFRRTPAVGAATGQEAYRTSPHVEEA
jgi:sterol desaturase/sphingolipid hydroxylase (fatty acid hydroxylase superfamily)